MRELIVAHNTDQASLEEEFQNTPLKVNFEFGVPIKIIHVMSNGKSYNQSKQMQQILTKTGINPIYIVPEKSSSLVI